MLALLLTLGLAAAGHPASSDGTGSSISPSQQLRSTVLRIHDEERRRVGSPPIAWDDGLARDAAAWARHLAATDTFDHCSEVGCPTSEQGENLWMGTKGGFGLDRMLHDWSDERRLLKGMSSWEDDHHSVGHYTQMVWSRTSKVGCALASNLRDEYLVCRYMEAGNVMGESPYADDTPSTSPQASESGDAVGTDAVGVRYVDGGEEDPADGAIDEGYSDGPDGTTVVTSTSPEGITTVVTTTVTSGPR